MSFKLEHVRDETRATKGIAWPDAAAFAALRRHPTPMALLDTRGVVLEGNEALERLFGGDSRTPLSLAERIAGDDGAQVVGVLMREVALHGRWDGEIAFRHPASGELSMRTMIGALPGASGRGAPGAYLAVFQDSSHVREYERRLEFVVHHDSLTDLPKRSVLKHHLDRAMVAAARGGTRLALLFLDIDHFKHVNDSIGYASGDGLLRQVAQRLRACTRGGDFVSRFGGDEFVVLVQEIIDVEQAGRAAQRLLDTLARPFQVDGRELYATASIGIGLFPDDGSDVDSLMQHADAALHRAKEWGRNQYQYYSAELGVRALESLNAPGELRRALVQDEFLLCYQPFVGTANGRVTGYEALVRWRHPRRGTLLPDQFIVQAEEHGLIGSLFDHVLETAAVELGARLLSVPELRFSINLSPRQLVDRSLATRIARVLESRGIPATRCEVEITENALVHFNEDVMRTLRELGELGIQIALDDFGAGYSSLGYLKDLPLNRLKVDRRFIAQLGSDQRSAAIVRAIVAVGHGLGLSVVAEGVEAEAQLEALRTLGCDEVQGYLFGVPAPVAELGR